MPTAPNPAQHVPERRASLADAAAYLGVNTKTVRLWIAKGHLTGYRTGPRLIQVDRDELEKMVQRIPTAASQ